MLKINMFSTADKVKGQGVGSAYDELMAMLKQHFTKEFKITVNNYGRADISHYHTINPAFICQRFPKTGAKNWLRAFYSGNTGRQLEDSSAV
ncbi:hypothetical protein [Lentilactobacillus kisonensis]|uniref:hypothetical protein n=1 Tax=Lentilactobacillus kisonensis TaxID=481722 RepID=UPI000A82BC30